MMTPYLYSKEYKEDMILLDKIISSIIGVKLFFIFTEFFYSGTCFLSFFFFKFIWLHWILVSACRIQLPDQGANPGPLHGESSVLTTGSPGKS